ncbi:MAG: MoaD/ThiS family protein [Candidatus Poribacteria bacterium]|nr:MoaD/ThiS family protein [Candidatus Poribacteria bacterium]
MATVFIPPLMRRHTGGVEQVEVEGATLRLIIEALEERFPGVKQRLMQDGQIMPGVAASIDGETETMGLIQPVQPDSEIHFIPAIGGG